MKTTTSNTFTNNTFVNLDTTYEWKIERIKDLPRDVLAQANIKTIKHIFGYEDEPADYIKLVDEYFPFDSIHNSTGTYTYVDNNASSTVTISDNVNWGMVSNSTNIDIDTGHFTLSNQGDTSISSSDSSVTTGFFNDAVDYTNFYFHA